MSATNVAKSCLVTCYYAEKSSSDFLYAPLSTTLGELRNQIHTKIKSTLKENWGEQDAINPNSASIVISASKHGSKEFTNNSLTIGDLCAADEYLYAIIPSKLQGLSVPPDVAALYRDGLTQPLLDKIANSKPIMVTTMETREKERKEHAMEKSMQDKQMEQIMTGVKVMIDESEKRLKEELAKADAKAEKLACELAKADEKLACELAKADEKLEKLACELAKADEKLAKANKRIDELQFELRSTNDRADEMSFKLQEVDAATMEALDWIAIGDTALLDRIKLRNLLNIAQERLALSCQLTDTPAGASLVWRDQLGYTEDFPTRLATAHRLLGQEHVQLDDRTKRFVDSPEGMRLVVEKASQIREQGDRVAHHTPPIRKIYQGTLARFNNAGVRAIVEFVCV